MAEAWELRLGEERPVKLPVLEPPAAWTAEVAGMQSAVRVTRLWASDPYPDDDEDDPDAPPPERSMVFMVRATAPGRATVRFTPGGPGLQPEPREIDVSVIP